MGHDDSERDLSPAGQVTKDWVTLYYSDLLEAGGRSELTSATIVSSGRSTRPKRRKNVF